MFHFEIGSLIDNRYRILSVLGTGGQGAVYKAEDTKADKKIVAVKVVYWTQSDDGENALRRVTAEYAALRKISHPNIIRVLEAGRLGKDSCFIAMEYVGGETLSRRIERQREEPLTFEEVLRTLHAMAKGLECVHAAQILHRDLKPANILIGAPGELKILDFGLARDMELGHTITKTGETVGTPDYMSPEQLTRMAALDNRTDIYSFGIIAYQMVVGVPPFTSGAYHEVATGHLTKPIPKIVSKHYKVPRWFQAFVVLCTEKKRFERYQSMTEVRVFLERRMASMGIIEKPENAEPKWMQVFGRLAWGG